LSEPGIIVAPGAHNAFTAKIIEPTGEFQAVYMTVSGTATRILGEKVNVKIIVDNEYLADPDSFYIPFYQTRHLFSTDPTAI
jgi:2-methylisocitrate lyase-like PEP mutase family enzyme